MTLDVVVSRFNEDIEWTTELRPDCRVFVYNKGDGAEPRLPNAGREAHTYLLHIYNNHTHLPDWTFFSQGDPNQHLPQTHLKWIIHGFPETIFKCALHLEGGPHFFTEASVRYNQGFKDGEDWESGVFYIWNDLFTSKIPEDILFAPASIFAISKERLLLRSTAFYKKAMELAVSRPRGPWEFERLWAYLWRDKDTPRL